MLINIDPKALEHACQCAGRSVHHFDRMALDLPLRASIVAHARAIEQHEAFRQDVSDALNSYYGINGCPPHQLLARFIIAKPDPLVEAWIEATGNTVGMEPLNEALAKRGGKIVWGEG